jgi:hypothetical protein
VTVTVQGTELSAIFSLTNNNPVPTLGSITPTTGTLQQPVTLTLTGTNFLAGAIINFGSNADTGGVVSNGGTTLTITIPATQVNEAGPVSVTVTNPAPTTGPSASQTFKVSGSAPTSNLVIAISGSISVPAGSPGFSFPVESVGGLAGALTSECSSPTAGCTISPCPTALFANRSVTLTVNLSPLPKISGGFKPALPRLPLPTGWRLFLGCLTCLLLAGLMSIRKQSVRWGFAAATLAFGLIAGCGSSSSPTQNSVPAGQYSVSITAKLGTATQTVQVMVNVQ